ncbi:MAG TPA: hypothetical protein VL485_23180 [Ktedonobacteraceae bacterium]|jgi:FtsZ-binding cell division protein ZapB|nr:hypothetical protein [Ktedonobacteraceae bacterium]
MMGVERAVTRWYVLRQMLQSEIARLAEKEEQLSGSGSEQTTVVLDESRDAVHQQLVAAQERLKALGHCPRPMMG